VQLFRRKKSHIALMATMLLATSAYANEPMVDELPEPHRWGFGLQVAPLTFGLSLQYAFNEEWGTQAVISSVGDKMGLNLRALHRAQTTTYWHSYQFVSFATSVEDNGSYDADGDWQSNNETDEKLSVGMGVDWNWQGSNPRRPPISVSLELGLAYVVTNEIDRDPNDNDRLHMMVGTGFHYRFN